MTYELVAFEIYTKSVYVKCMNTSKIHVMFEYLHQLLEIFDIFPHSNLIKTNRLADYLQEKKLFHHQTRS